MDKYSFAALITTTLADHPDWMGAALQGITEGSAMALRAANERAAEKDQAMLAALTLASNLRLGTDVAATLRNRVVRSINPNGACQIEKDFLAKGEAA